MEVSGLFSPLYWTGSGERSSKQLLNTIDQGKGREGVGIRERGREKEEVL